MCIVVDTNSMASVFKPKTSDHDEFKPVNEWIINGKGKLIIGGTHYEKEISSFLGLISNLAKVKKVVKICCDVVDKEKERLEKIVTHRDYDDSHVVALLSTSKCKIICSKDKRAHQFFKRKELYQSGQVPSIYSGSRHKHLLNDINIIDICAPCIRLKKNEIESII